MSSKQSEELSKKKSKHRKRRENGFEEWGGYMAAKKQKLEMQFEDKKALELMDQKETQIFKGISIFVNGLTTPPASELKRLMLIHGGKFYHFPTSKITHVIASNLPKSKMKLLKTQVIVTGNWITDSIKAGKLLPHQNYFLYSPEIADKQQRLQIGSYFQKKSNSPSVTETVEGDNNTPEKKNKNTSMLENLFGEDLDSDSSIDSEQNAECNLTNNNHARKESSSNSSYQKHSASNHIKVLSPEKSSLTGSSSIAVFAQNQRIPSNDVSNLKPSLSSSEKLTINKISLSKIKNKNKSISTELFGEDLESNSNIGVEQNIKSSSIIKNSPHKISADASYKKHGKNDHSRVLSLIKPSSNVSIPVSSQNQSNPCQESSHLKPSLHKPGNHTFNEESLSKKKRENKTMLDELFGEDLDSDSSIESEQNARTVSIDKIFH